MTISTMRKPSRRPLIFKVGSAIVFVAAALIILYGFRVASNSPFFNASVFADFLKAKIQGQNAFPGNDGWLFYRCDLVATLEPWIYMRKNVETIAALSDTLSRRGIKLIVVSVPYKAAIIQTYSPFRVGNVSNQRSRMLTILSKRSVEVIDLAPSFMAENPKDALFQKKDTHWDGHGMLIAARIISDSINRFLGRAGGQQRYFFKDTIIFEPRDLGVFLGDTSSYPRSCRMITMQDGSAFKDSVGSDIMIFGDSFSFVDHAFGGSIGAQIAYFTNRPTFTIFHICATREPLEMLNFLKNRGKVPRVIVWVFVSNVLCAKFAPI
jgi:hypothetical protein